MVVVTVVVAVMVVVVMAAAAMPSVGTVAVTAISAAATALATRILAAGTMAAEGLPYPARPRGQVFAAIVPLPGAAEQISLRSETPRYDPEASTMR